MAVSCRRVGGLHIAADEPRTPPNIRSVCPSDVLSLAITRNYALDTRVRKPPADVDDSTCRGRRNTTQHTRFHPGSVGVRGSNPLSSTTTPQPKSAKSRRVVPIDPWLADDLRAYLANDHPHGDAGSAGYDPDAPLFPGRYGMTEGLPQGVARLDIEPVDR